VFVAIPCLSPISKKGKKDFGYPFHFVTKEELDGYHTSFGGV
jgi:hypothetical protein